MRLIIGKVSQEMRLNRSYMTLPHPPQIFRTTNFCLGEISKSDNRYSRQQKNKDEASCTHFPHTALPKEVNGTIHRSLS